MAVMMPFTNTAPRPGLLMKSHQPHSHSSPFNANNDTSIVCIEGRSALLLSMQTMLVFVYFCIRSLNTCLRKCSTNTNVKTVRKLHLHDPKVHWRESGALEKQELEWLRMTTITLLLVRFTEGGRRIVREKRERIWHCAKALRSKCNFDQA
jgi:hypothetical protein